MLARAKNPGRRQTTQSVTLPAPVGGMNSVAPASELPEMDCLLLYNMVGSEYGLRSRTGYEEWVTGLDGAPLTEIPFSGSASSGSADRLFVSTLTGIWNCTVSSNSPSRVVNFALTTGLAGYGISHGVQTLGGHFLLHCDEENGLYFYTEASDTWTKVAAGATQLWTPSTFYTVGNHVVNGANAYIVASVTSDQKSASSGGPTGTGTGISDNHVTWNYVSAAVAHAVGPSLADQQNGLSLDPANLVFVTVWKNRVWYLEKATSRAWYGDVNSFLGTFSSFDFGLKLPHGGPLAGLYNWSYDGGSGMDTLLVGVSSAGDVVIYKGTDPTSADTFGLSGVWYVGSVPAGRRVATDYGGDILLNSALGALPLSKLVVGDPYVDRSQYLTQKVGNRFALFANSLRTLPGWAVHIHPQDNVLLILVPQGPGQPPLQLAYSFATKGWSFYRDLPMVSAGVWNGETYFGTPDGRVCRHTGYIDNVQLSDPNAWSPVNYSLVSRYDNLGNANQKRIVMLIPTLLSDSASPSYSVVAKYGLDTSEAPAPTLMGGSTDAGVWGTSLWGSAIWGGDYSAAQPVTGASGIGRDVAVALRGAADSRTILVDVKVLFELGGLL